MIRNEDNPENSVLPILISPIIEPLGQIGFCENLIANLFEKRESPRTKKFPDVKIKIQLLISHNGIYTKEIRSLKAFHDRYLIQTDNVDTEFSKLFTQYIKNIQHQNSQRATHSPSTNPINLSSSTIQSTPQTSLQKKTSNVPSENLGSTTTSE